MAASDWIAIAALIISGIIVPGLGILGWIVKSMKDERKELAKDVDELEKKVSKLELKVAEEYTPIRRHLDSEDRLTKAIDKLTGKIDDVLRIAAGGQPHG